MTHRGMSVNPGVVPKPSSSCAAMSAGVAPACSISVTLCAAPTLASSRASVASDANGST